MDTDVGADAPNVEESFANAFEKGTQMESHSERILRIGSK